MEAARRFACDRSRYAVTHWDLCSEIGLRSAYRSVLAGEARYGSAGHGMAGMVQKDVSRVWIENETAFNGSHDQLPLLQRLAPHPIRHLPRLRFRGCGLRVKDGWSRSAVHQVH